MPYSWWAFSKSWSSSCGSAAQPTPQDREVMGLIPNSRAFSSSFHIFPSWAVVLSWSFKEVLLYFRLGKITQKWYMVGPKWTKRGLLVTNNRDTTIPFVNICRTCLLLPVTRNLKLRGRRCTAVLKVVQSFQWHRGSCSFPISVSS